MAPKYASPYSLVKTPLQQTKFYSLHDARSRESGEVWLARVVHSGAMAALGASDHVSYNEEALLNLKEKDTVIYVQEVFIKDGDSFFIQEKYHVRLSNYLQEKGVLPAQQAEKILKDLFRSVCDVYQEGYVLRSIRPEHLVLVKGDTTDEQDIWKVETLVLDNKEFPVDTPFTWRKATASPEERAKPQELDDEMLDAQLVWNFGYLALQLILGNEAMAKVKRDSDIQWLKVKQLCSLAPHLYDMIEKCFRFQFSDRISLKKFFDLRIFEECDRQGFGDFFLTASKVFKSKPFALSVNLKNLKSNIPNKNMTPPKMQMLPEYSAEKELNTARANFLQGVTNYLSYIQSNEPTSRLNENKTLVEYYFLKLQHHYMEKADKIEEERMKDRVEEKLNAKSKIVKRIKGTENMLLKQWQIDPKENYSLPQLIAIFNKLCGYAYSRIKETCEKSEKTECLKAFSYFAIAAILVNLNDLSEIHAILDLKKGQNLMEVFENAKPEVLAKISQSLVGKYFKTE